MNSAVNNDFTPCLPFFSVVLTSYNRAALLKRALQSLIQQTESDWEAIIVDDGSTDGTYSHIAPVLITGNQFLYYRQNGQGCVAAKNAGIQLSAGKYITFLDSDDEYSPDHLATRKHILLQQPDTDILHGGISIIGSPYVPDRYDIKKMIHLDDCVIGGTFFIKKKLVLTLNGFTDITLGHDAEFLDRAAAGGAVVAKTKTRTYIYHRETQNSITNNLATCSGI